MTDISDPDIDPDHNSESETDSDQKGSSRRQYFLAGLLALIPIWITYLIIEFLFRTLAKVGLPLVNWLADQARPRFPALESLLQSGIFLAIVSFILVVILIYLLGVLTSIVVGRRLIALFEALVNRVPFVKSVYSSIKKLTTVLQEKPEGNLQRVVLIDFPSPEMKTVGLVTRVLTENRTGRKLAAVYVPTTPNPTSGYLEIVPIERLTPTEWSMDEAMSFIISGGAVAPDKIVYDSMETLEAGTPGRGTDGK